MLGRGVAVALSLALGGGEAWAHAGLRQSDPAAGATLGDTPTAVRLTFWETPEASLSVLRVLDTAGTAYQFDRAAPDPASPLALTVRVRPLPRGVYTVNWRVFSAVDGHVTTGAYAFGVLVAPSGPLATRPDDRSAATPLEIPARWMLIAGLSMLLGVAFAGAARFGGAGEIALGAFGWLLAVFGLILLAEAQRRNADASYAALLGTPTGSALVGRAAAIATAGGAWLLAGRTRPWVRRTAMAIAAVATAAAMAVHVSAGHAASGHVPWAPTVAQWAHFAAAGLWLGGLAPLLLGVRGSPSVAKAAAVRRFSAVAVAGLVVVAATGTIRALDELSSWRDLVSTGYGLAVSAKIVLLAGIAALGAFNRWRGVVAAATDLRPLRRAAGAEIALAVCALWAAAALGSLPPPAAVRRIGPPGLSASGADFGTTVRVQLEAASVEPGPNRFVVRAVDYDSRVAVRGSVSLRFTPLDDPGVAPTSLPLVAAPDDSHVGSGSNLAFDGRWRVTVRIERAGESVEVPLDVQVSRPPRFVSVERIPGQAPKYTVSVIGGDMRFSPDPEFAGRSHVYVTCFDVLGDPWDMEQIVVTAGAGRGAVTQQPVRRLSVGRFVADVVLRPGRNTIAAVTRAGDGTRVRASVDLDVPGRRDPGR